MAKIDISEMVLDRIFPNLPEGLSVSAYAHADRPQHFWDPLMQKFDAWRDRLEKNVKVRTHAWEALQSFVNHLKRIKASGSGLKPPMLQALDLGEDLSWADDVKSYTLKLIYRLTLPPAYADQAKLEADAVTRKALDALATQAENFVMRLKKKGVLITTKSPGACIHLTPLLEVYETAAKRSRQFLHLLDVRYVQRPKTWEHCLPVINLAGQLKISERQTLELIRLALLAHGYTEDQVEDLRNVSKIRAGTFRKKKESSLKQTSSFYSELMGEF